MATASVECNKVLDAKDNENNLLAFPSLVSDYNDPNAEDCLYFAPYGQTPAVNVLENFLGTPDTVTKVLFLKSGDMRNALCTAAQITEAYQELSVHLTDPNDLVVARNILLAHIMLSDDFDASNPVDIQYLWDIWYSLRWTEVTRSRFLKDVEHLLTFQWSTAAHIVIEAGVSVKLLERILKAWLETATKMSSQSVVNISKHRVKTIIQDESFEMAMQRVENIDSYLSQNLTTEQRMNKLANTIYSKKRINLKLEEESIKKEIECFLRTGNFEPVDLVVCLNPTLLSEGVDNEKLCWEVAYHTCPFDAYFPVPLKDQLANLEKNFTSAYDFCKSKLQSLVSELQSRKKRVSFHFYFCDWVELCLFDKDQKLKNKFHVAHCSELADTVGLANVLVAVTGCLIQDYPEALLLTETTDWTKHHLLEEEIPSISEYVEMALCCPLSMVPTFYGLKLVNHTKLGSAVCIQMHDSSSTSSIMLSWVIAPTYSSNVSLDISPALKNALAPLAECCYIVSEEWNCQPFPTQAPNSLGLRRTNDVHYLLPYTPLTYHLVLQSVEKRFVWLPGAAKSLFLDAVPAPHQLACKTQQSWLNGEPVLLFTIKASSFQRLQESLDEMDAQLLLMTDEELALRENYPEDHLKGHCIDFVCWSDCMVGNMDHVNGIIVSDDDEEEEGDQEKAEKSFSFILASDHGLPLNTRFCIHNGEESTITTFGLFTDFTNQVVTNECPLLGEKRLPLESDSEASGLHIVKCLESKDRYDLDICVKGFPTTSTKDFRITTNKQHPSLSAHQITLALAGVAPVVMQVPWPILAADVKISIPKKLKDKLLFNLKLTKSLNDPWPAEFIGSSKWDADQLVQWKELVSNGDFKKHIEAQFPCDHLHTEKYTPEDKPESSSLAKVGEAVRAIFYGYCDDSFQLFAICDPLTQEPIFHLRVHPPMRFSPQGAPLLLMSLLDHQLVHGLVTEGKLDAEQSQADFHRIITEGVSRNVCKVQLSSPEEVRLLRYSLRLNSTKILRNAWQSKNFPKGEDSPWMASFVSPLYAEEPLDMCALLEMKHNRDPSYLLSLALAEGFSRIILGGQDDNDGDDSYTDSEYDSN